MKNVLGILLLIIILHKISFAQNIDISQNIINKTLFSPAFVGAKNNTELFTGFIKKWTGISGSPQTTFLNYNMPVFEKNGLGISIFDEQQGNFHNINISLQTSYKVKLSQNSKLLFGISGQLLHSYFDFNNAKSQANDPVFSNINSLKFNVFDMGAGIAYVSNKFVGSISSSSLLGTNDEILNGNAIYTRSQNLYLYSSYNFKLNENINLQPQLLLNNEFNKTILINYKVSALLKYKDKAHLIFSYRNNNFMGFGIGGALSSNLILSYFYETSFGGIAGLSSGTHQINLGILIVRHSAFDKDDIFPITKNQIIADENNREIKELRAEVELLKNHFNKTISYQDGRIKTVEASTKIENKVNSKNKIIWKDTIYNDNITFALNTDLLHSSSFSEIDKIAIMMFNEPSILIKITTDVTDFGSPIHLQQLSLNRGKTIKKYLIKRGINEKRIILEKGKINNSEVIKILISE